MAWLQAKRPFRLTTPLGADVLLLTSWHGEEHVSSFFRYRVEAFSERADISAKDLLLKNVSLAIRLPDGTDRTVHGIVSWLGRGGNAPVGFVKYELEIVPPHWALSLDEGFEIFQNKSARDICTTLLAGTPHDWKLTGTPEPRPYCFRYRESRWNCVARLLEQEGIFFRYDHTGGEAKLVLGDSVSSAKPAWGVAHLEFNASPGVDSRLTDLRVESTPYASETRVRTASEFLPTNNISDFTAASGKFVPPSDIKTYRFEQQLAAHHSGISHSGGATASDAAKLPTEVKRISRMRQELAESMAVRFVGESRYTGLEPGSKTEVKAHPNADMNGPLFITSVWHVGSNGSFVAGDSAEASYTNRFEAAPASTPFRPARVTPWPHIGGSHVGLVVGPDGEEIFTDTHGRVQVVFKWDWENSKALTHSCWIRVAQSFAGQQFGSVFLPRIGHEVIVEFLDGDPDMPVVVGSLYNAANMPPWKLPDHKTQSGIKTKSTLKGAADNYNELRFEDLKGSEQVYVQAERNLDTLVKANETRTVGYDRTTTIKHDETKTVEEGNEVTVIKKGSQTIVVEDNDRSLTVEKTHEVLVRGEEKITVIKDRTVTVDGAQTHLVKKDDTTRVKGNQASKITGDKVTIVDSGEYKLNVKSGDVTVKAGQGSMLIKADTGAIVIKAEQGIELKCGENKIIIDQTGITIKGIKVEITGDATAKLSSAMVTVESKGPLMASGKPIMLN